MDSSAEVLAADERRRAAMRAADAVAMERLLSDKLVYTHASGKLDTKQSYLAGLRSGQTIFHDVKVREAAVRMLGDDCAFVTGLQESDLTGGGERRFVRLRFLSVWARDDGAWRMAAWAATMAPPA